MIFAQSPQNGMFMCVWECVRLCTHKSSVTARKRHNQYTYEFRLILWLKLCENQFVCTTLWNYFFRMEFSVHTAVFAAFFAIFFPFILLRFVKHQIDLMFDTQVNLQATFATPTHTHTYRKRHSSRRSNHQKCRYGLWVCVWLCVFDVLLRIHVIIPSYLSNKIRFVTFIKII